MHCVEEENFIDKYEDDKLKNLNIYKEDVIEHIISRFLVKQLKKNY